MRATDQFHVGIVVHDLDAALARLTEDFGYDWCPEMALSVPVRTSGGDGEVDMRFTYSRTVPRLEVIQAVPGTAWTPAAGSGIHHLGYWTSDVTADIGRLAGRGYTVEVWGAHPDGTATWSFLRRSDGPRIELVSRALEPGLQQYWEGAAAS